MTDARRSRLALLVAVCFFMEILDGTIVVTAAPSIGDELLVGAASSGLIVTAYLVTAAVFIPLSAWMTARHGARRVFVTALVVFTGASLGCGLSSSFAELVGFRVLQGIGGAMMVPVGRIVVFADAPKAQIVRLTSYIVWPGLLAPVVAPLLGGLITTYVGWRWIFLINIPIGLAAIGLALRLMAAGPQRALTPLDRRGFALVCTGLAALTYAAHLTSDAHPRWGHAAVLAAAAATLLVLAARHLWTAPAPLLEITTLRVPTYGIAIAGAAVFWLTLGTIPFLLPIMFQTRFGWDAVLSGAMILFLFLGNVAIKPATTPLYRRHGFRRTLLIATAGLTSTTLAIAAIGPSTPMVVIAALLVASGVTRSVGLTGLSTLALSDVDERQVPHAVTLMSVVQQLFPGLGVAFGALALRAGDALSPAFGTSETSLAPFHIAFVLIAVASMGSFMAVLRLTPRAGARLLMPMPAGVGPSTRQGR